MSWREVERLLAAPAPAFRCRPAGRKSGDREHVARIRHELRAPAAVSAIEWLRHELPRGNEQLIDLYARTDGLVLYRDTNSDAAGVALFAIEQMLDATADMKRWLDMLDANTSEEPMLYSALAIGCVPRSANYFAMPREGVNTGRVFLVLHDDWRDEPFAESIEEFLARVTRDPVKLLVEDLGCTARYSDGATATQWIPHAYLEDAR